MKTYRVTITETAVHHVLVEADTEDDARAAGLSEFLGGKATFSHVEDRDVDANETDETT
jgi:hypothetical protein